MTQLSSTTTSDTANKSGSVTVTNASHFSRTRSPNSLAEASSLLALSQPVTFGSEPQEQIGTSLDHTPASGEQGDGPALSLQDSLQPKDATQRDVTAEERESSQPCPSSETRTGRTPSLSAAEAMLMLTVDFTTVPDDAAPEDTPHVQEDEPLEHMSLEGRDHSSSDVQVEEEVKPAEESTEGTMDDTELHLNPCDSDGLETRKEELMDPSPLSQDNELNGVFQPAISAPDEPTDAGSIAQLTVDTHPITAAEQSVAITKLLSPPESSPSVTDYPPQDISEGLAALEAVSSEEEQIESHMGEDEEESKQGAVEGMGGGKKSPVTDIDRRGNLSESRNGKSFHERELTEGEDGSLPSDAAAYTPGVTCNGQVHAVTRPTHHNLDKVGAEEVSDSGANNPQLSQSEGACLQHSALATEGPIAAPVQLLTPPLDRDQVFTCALPEASDTVSHPQSTHFKHHDSTRKRRNYRHSSHKEHSSSKFNHRRSLSPTSQRRDRDRHSTERSAYHHSGSEHRSSQHQADPKTSHDRSTSRDWGQDRPSSVHEGQEYQNFYPHRDSGKANSTTKHRHHDGQRGPHYHDRYSQQNGHHQTQPRSSQWDDRRKHSSTHRSNVRDTPREDMAGNGGHGHKRRHSSYSEHSSSDLVPKPKRTVT